MSLYVEERKDGSYAFFMEGDLQFDSRDEAIYHESMALPALSLSESLLPEGMHILICGGGDGLVLRECLRFPNVARVDLVDIDESVIELGRTHFAESNQHAFEDARVHVTIGDAWDFLDATSLYDVIICDFTVPRRPEETRIFTQEWYQKLKASLTPKGMLALNTVSPERTPEAFYCLKRTVRSTGLYPVPYRVCIPSFRNQGYGTWGFLLASPRPIGIAHLHQLKCPVTTQQADIANLWRGASFTREQRRIEGKVPIHTLANPTLLPLILNPSIAAPEPLPEPTETEPYSLDALIRAIPIQHAYHTHEMIEAVAETVVGSFRTLDIPRFVDALLERAAQLPKDIVEELERLKEFLRLHVTLLETFWKWCSRVFALLVVIMTLANIVAPDNAFGKGSFGLGRASIGRGFSSSYSVRGTSGSTGTRGSFGFGGHEATGSFSAPPARITSTGFRNTYGRGGSTDIYGNPYRSRVFTYQEPDVYVTYNYNTVYTGRGGGSRAGAGTGSSQSMRESKSLFVADEDLMVLDNGDVVVTLSDTGYLLLKQGHVYLMHQKQTTPIMEMYADSELFLRVSNQLKGQAVAVRNEREAHENWLGWTSWTSNLFPTVAADKREYQNLLDLEARLAKTLQTLGSPPESKPIPLEPGTIELFTGTFLLPNGLIALRNGNGTWIYTDGKQWYPEKEQSGQQPCPPPLSSMLKEVIAKLTKEIEADIQADKKYLQDLAQERASMDVDLIQYNQLGHTLGMAYTVDYGTEEIPAYSAISRTQQEIDNSNYETRQTLAEIEKWEQNVTKLRDFRF